MRLLPKSEVEKARAADKMREIQEGMKLSKRVDNLREVAAHEEASIEEWRKNTLKVIYDEIQSVSAKCDSLKWEVQTLEERRKAALAPIQDAWNQLKDAQARVIREETEVSRREKLVKISERAIELTQKQIEEVKKGIELQGIDSDSRFQESFEARKQAELVLDAAEGIKASALALRQRVESDLLHREGLVTSRERDVTIKETEQAAERRKIADGWRLLKDREAQFERVLKRNK